MFFSSLIKMNVIGKSAFAFDEEIISPAKHLIKLIKLILMFYFIELQSN